MEKTPSTSQVININNPVINNNIYIVNFPKNEDEEIQFVKDHITQPILERIWNDIPPQQAFRNYAKAILEREENHIIHRTNPGTKYCRVRRDGNWEFELNKNAMEILTSQLAISASDDIENYRDTVQKKLINVKRILKYLLDLDADYNNYYSKAIDNIQVIIMNLSNIRSLSQNPTTNSETA